MSLFAVADHGSVYSCAPHIYVEVYFNAVCLLCSALIDMGSAVLNRALFFYTYQKWLSFLFSLLKHPFLPHHNVWHINQMHPKCKLKCAAVARSMLAIHWIIKLASTQMPLPLCDQYSVSWRYKVSLHTRFEWTIFACFTVWTHFPHLCTQNVKSTEVSNLEPTNCQSAS